MCYFEISNVLSNFLDYHRKLFSHFISKFKLCKQSRIIWYDEYERHENLQFYATGIYLRCLFLKNLIQVQGDLNQKLRILMAITLKLSISSPIFLKSKFIWEMYINFENWKQTGDKNANTCPLLKHILTLQTQAQKWLISEVEPFELATFDLVRPVVLLLVFFSFFFCQS